MFNMFCSAKSRKLELSEDDYHPTSNLYSFTKNGCLYDFLRRPVFLCNLSCCCKRNFPASVTHCSVITKVHNFSLSSLTCFVKDKQTLKTEDTNWIFSVTDQSGRLFPIKLQSLQQTFQRIIQAYYWRNIFTAFAVGWVVRTKLNSPKNVESFSSLPSIYGYFGKADEKQLNTPPWKDLYLRTSVRK